jgi:hypothetical protein
MKHTEREELLGLSFDAATVEIAIARHLEQCRGPCSSLPVTAVQLTLMRRDLKLSLAYLTSHLSVADGLSVHHRLTPDLSIPATI